MGVTKETDMVFENGEALKSAIDQYFEKCTAISAFPDYAGMRLALHLTEEKIKEMQSDDNEKADEFKQAFNYAKDRRESWLARRSIDNKAAQGCLNMLKQPCNGGYIDKPADNKEKVLTLKVEGVGGVDAFK